MKPHPLPPADKTVEAVTESIEVGETKTVAEPTLVSVDVGPKASDVAAGYSEVEESEGKEEEAPETLGPGSRLSEIAFADKPLTRAATAAEAAAETDALAEKSLASSADLTAAEAELAAAEAAETAFCFASSSSLCCLKHSSW